MPALVIQFPIGPMANFGYLIGDPRTKEAIVVDPAWSPEEIFKVAAAENLRLVGMAVTHAHFDHSNAIELLLHKIDVPVYANADEVPYAKSGTNIVGDLGRTVKTVRGGEKIKIGDTEIEFLHTPGHTPGSQCLRVENKLITGDTLFIGGCGRSDLPGGNAPLLFKTLRKLAAMPGELTVCPGHDYGAAPTRLLRDEIAHNPYLKMTSEDAFLDAVS